MNWTILRMQLWELWRVGRNEIACRTMGLLGFFLVLQFLGGLSLANAGMEELRDIFMSFAYMGWLLNACAPFLFGYSGRPGQGQLGYLKSQYAKPVSTLQLFLAPLLFGIFMQALSSMLLAWILHSFLGLGYPYFVPLLIALVFSITSSCSAIAFRNPWHLVGAAVAIDTLVLARLWPNFLGSAFMLENAAHWHALVQVSALDHAVFGCVALAALALGHWGLHRRRQGGSDYAMSTSTRPRTVDLGRGPHRLPFASAFRAQWWMFLAALFWMVSVAQRAGVWEIRFTNIHLWAFFVGVLCIPLGSAAWAPLALDARRSQ